MSSLGKIKKNAEKFELNQIYKNMTPEQYQEGIRIAVNKAISNLAIEYDNNIKKLKQHFEYELKGCTIYAIDTLSVELLYELANQLGCFEENPDYLEDKIYRVKEIYENTMDSIKKYANYKNDKQARKEFEKKKKKVEKMFDIKFED